MPRDADRNDGRRARGVAAWSGILRLSEAAHDAVLVSREPGGPRPARGADVPACRRCGAERALRNLFAASHDLDVIALPIPVSGDALNNALARHADLLMLEPRKATRQDVETLKTAGVSEADIVRLSELAAFVNYQLRVVAGVKLPKAVEAR